MPTYKRTKMCQECPFRKCAPSGWLGPWSVDDFEHFIQSDDDLICHVDTEIKKDLTKEQIKIKGQHCVGILRYKNIIFKLSRDRRKADAQIALKNIKDQPIIDLNKFREHHTKYK